MSLPCHELTKHPTQGGVGTLLITSYCLPETHKGILSNLTILYFCSERHKFWIVFLVEIIQGSHVFTVTDQPVDGRKMLPLSKLLVQAPKYLYYKINIQT